jgi:hypothetical protein
MEVVFIHLLGNSDTGPSEMTRLAYMEIGYDEHRFVFPK